MRAVHEQPRVAAKAPCAVCLVAVRILVDGALSGDRRDGVQAAQVRLVSVPQAGSALRRELDQRTVERDRAVAARASAELRRASFRARTVGFAASRRLQSEPDTAHNDASSKEP